jgi:hypothetical protein
MSKGPERRRRPADVIGNAVMVGRIATGYDVDVMRGGVGRFSKSGAASRAVALLQEQRSDIGRKAAEGRWR